MTWTIYPAHGRMNEGPLGYRLGDFAGMAFMHDYMRTLNPLQGIMELQPGQVNWGEFNPQPYPGAVRLWILRAFAGGARLVCTYRYRQPLSGAELYHKGIVETDGVTLAPGGREYVQAIKDVQLDHYYKGNAAAVTRRLGRGSVTYVGVESLNGELERDLLRGVFERAGVTARDLPSGFHVEWREGFWVATNFTERTLPAPAPAGAKILLGSRDVPPAGVTVWVE